MAQTPTSGAVIVSYDSAHGDHPLMLVGKQVSGRLEIINAFTGDAALELYEKLVIPSPEIFKNRRST